MLELKRLEDFDAYKVNFKGFGFKSIGTALAGQTTNVDFQLAEERLIYGGQSVLKNHCFGDEITMQIIYKSQGNPDVVLGQYIEDWPVADDVQEQDPVMVTYPTKVNAGLFMRIKYKSIGQTDVQVCMRVYAVKNMTGL